MRSRDRLLQILPTVNVKVVTPDEQYQIIAEDNLRGAELALRGELPAPRAFANVLAVNLKHSRLFVSDHVRELLAETIQHLEGENT